jgi:hypothetical protein
MSRYVRQKFWEAARALAGDGDMEKRIRFAGDCLIGLQEDQIPVANLEEFLAIRAAFFTPSGRNYVPRQVSRKMPWRCRARSSISSRRYWAGFKPKGLIAKPSQAAFACFPVAFARRLRLDAGWSGGSVHA